MQKIVWNCRKEAEREAEDAMAEGMMYVGGNKAMRLIAN